MSLETEIRNALERHATDPRPRPQAWVEIGVRIARRNRRRALAGVVGTAAVVVAAAIVGPRILNAEPTPPIAPVPSVVPVPPEILPSLAPAGPLVVQAKIPAAASALAAGPEALWALVPTENPDDVSRLIRIDPSTDRVSIDTFAGFNPRGIAVDEDAVWITNGRRCDLLGTCDEPYVPGTFEYGFPQENSVVRVDPRNGAALAWVEVEQPEAVALGFGGAWVTSMADGKLTLVRVHADGTRAVARIPLGEATGPQSLAVGGGFVWVAAGKPSTGGPDAILLHRIDPATNRLVQILEIAGEPSNPELTFEDGSLWLAAGGQQSASGLMRVDPATGMVPARTVLPDAAPVGLSAISAGNGFVWAVGGRGSFWKIDPARGAPLTEASYVGEHPPVGAADVVTGFGSVWVAVGDGRIWRIQP